MASDAPASASPGPSPSLPTAAEIATSVRSGERLATDVVGEHLLRIAEHNERLSCFVSLDAGRARDVAEALDDRRSQGRPLGPLAGVPVGISDLTPTHGVRTTFGSRIYQNYAPRYDAILVERLRRADAVLVGKTTTTLFGIGTEVGFETRAPRHPRHEGLVTGGSAAGSAGALASGMVALADGIDAGGATGAAAAFHAIASYRPTPGQIPMWPTDLLWDTLPTPALLARNAGDLRLMAGIATGPDPRAPLSARPVSQDAAGHSAALPLGWTPDFGRYGVQPDLLEACRGAVSRLQEKGLRIQEVSLTPDSVDEVFQVLRAWSFALRYQADLHHHRDELPPRVSQQIEEGLKLNGLVIARAETLRARTFDAFRAIFERVSCLLAPATQVAPYPTEQLGTMSYETASTRFFGDMPIWYPAALAGLPCVSLPCGTTASGLPVSLQLCGPPDSDARLLMLAEQLEALLDVSGGADAATT